MTSSAIEWDPPSADDHYADLPVTKVFVTAYHPVLVGSSDIFAPPSKKQTNHWVMFFEISRNESIKVDPSLGHGNRLSLQLTPESHVATEHAQSSEIQPKGLTVRIFVDQIIAARYDRYRFVSSGQGCRHWISRVLELLRDAGHLDNVDDVLTAIRTVWDKDGRPVPDAAQSVPEKGAFI